MDLRMIQFDSARRRWGPSAGELGYWADAGVVAGPIRLETLGEFRSM